MTEQTPNDNQNPNQEPIVHDKRRIDPETGKVRDREVSDSETEADRPTLSEEDLSSLLNEAMKASAASDTAPGTDSEGNSAEQSDAANEVENPYLTDLKRVQAEYANYRRRTEQEKEEIADAATAAIALQLLPVLDDLDRAQDAGDLPEGSPLQVIASKLRGSFERLKVERYGEQGEVFDPRIHEAIAQLPNAEVKESVIADVVEVGYKIGDREIRAAKVAVFVPES